MQSFWKERTQTVCPQFEHHAIYFNFHTVHKMDGDFHFVTRKENVCNKVSLLIKGGRVKGTINNGSFDFDKRSMAGGKSCHSVEHSACTP